MGGEGREDHRVVLGQRSWIEGWETPALLLTSSAPAPGLPYITAVKPASALLHNGYL